MIRITVVGFLLAGSFFVSLADEKQHICETTACLMGCHNRNGNHICETTACVFSHNTPLEIDEPEGECHLISGAIIQNTTSEQCCSIPGSFAWAADSFGDDLQTCTDLGD